MVLNNPNSFSSSSANYPTLELDPSIEENGDTSSEAILTPTSDTPSQSHAIHASRRSSWESQIRNSFRATSNRTKEQDVPLRRSISELQRDYDNGNKKPLEDLIRAWIGVKNLPPHDPQSFFSQAGYHGEPFELRKDGKPGYYWGGYCNHRNILFPTWHRAYMASLEKALQSIVPGVMMPYWDQTDPETLKNGIPKILTQEKIELDGVMINNPFKSYTLPVPLMDNLPGKEGPSYTKPAGYTTVRYPLSGLVGTLEDEAQSAEHNAKYPYPEHVSLLNKNIVAWMNGGEPTPSHPNPTGRGVYTLYQQSLAAPNYTVLSNITSAGAWNKDHPGIVVPVELPHNDMHLAIGGFTWGNLTFGQIPGANGDMGENNTAGFDPIFFFHHCNVDRMFHLWQQKHGQTDELDIIPNYPGTNSNDGGPTTGIPRNMTLTLDTPLKPFLKNPSDPESHYTSRDVINPEKQLGYTYSRGSFDQTSTEIQPQTRPMTGTKAGFSTKKLSVSEINRSVLKGSFLLNAYATVKDENGNEKTYHLGHFSALSRSNPEDCGNCQTNSETIAHFPLSAIPENEVDKAKFRIELTHKGKKNPEKVSDFHLEVQD